VVIVDAKDVRDCQVGRRISGIERGRLLRHERRQRCECPWAASGWCLERKGDDDWRVLEPAKGRPRSSR